MLDFEQAKALFNQEAARIGTKDHIPFCSVKKIFGKEVAKSVLIQAIDDLKEKQDCDYYSVNLGNDTIGFLNFNGFLCAVSYANVREIKAMLDAKAATDGKAC